MFVFRNIDSITFAEFCQQLSEKLHHHGKENLGRRDSCEKLLHNND